MGKISTNDVYLTSRNISVTPVLMPQKLFIVETYAIGDAYAEYSGRLEMMGEIKYNRKIINSRVHHVIYEYLYSENIENDLEIANESVDMRKILCIEDFSAIDVAILCSNTNIVKKLLQSGATFPKSTPISQLNVAIINDNIDIVKLLIAAGEIPVIYDKISGVECDESSSNSTLKFIIKFNRVSILKLLFEFGMLSDKKSFIGLIELIYAHRRLDILKICVKENMILENQFFSILFIATVDNDLEILEILLNSDPNEINIGLNERYFYNSQSHTAYSYAKSVPELTYIAKLLLDYGAIETKPTR